LVYARKIYDAVHRSAVDSNTAVQIMGFSGKSGASASALGSVRQYNLIEGVGENTRISNLALEIFEPSSSDEQGRAIRRAAFAPKVFESISERFGGKIPQVDEPIRAYLIRDLGFSPAGATDCIQSLRATLASLPTEKIDSESDSSAGLSPQLADGADRAGTNQTREDSSLSSAPPTNGAGAQSRFPISKDCFAEITLLGEITPRALENLRLQVEFLIGVWGEE
jgi:hypothetical protein